MSDRHQQKPYPLRITDELRAKLEASAKEAGRSLNAEISHRLQATFDESIVTTTEARVRPAAGVVDDVSADEIADKVAKKLQVWVRGKPVEVERSPTNSMILPLGDPAEAQRTLKELYDRVYRALASVEGSPAFTPRGNEPYGPPKSNNACKRVPRK